jgi:alpha-galactosidase
MLPQKRPGSLGYEALDASTYASWGVGFVKEDSCYGERPPEVDYGIMRDALNATGRPMAFCVCNPGFGNASFGNQWRSGPDLRVYSQVEQRRAGIKTRC